MSGREPSGGPPAASTSAPPAAAAAPANTTTSANLAARIEALEKESAARKAKSKPGDSYEEVRFVE